MAQIAILNKYRNELGRTYRKMYDNGTRNEWCNRSNMRSYSCRSDNKCGTINTSTHDNLILEIHGE